MTSDLMSLHVLIVGRSAAERGLLRQGAARASMPTEVLEAEGLDSVAAALARNSIDLLLLDTGLPATDKRDICLAARAAKSRPFIVAVGHDSDGATIDASVARPTTAEEAQATVDCCVRSRLPARALIVDDSSTMRGIVRKILSASTFPLEISEVDEGVKALGRLREGGFEIVFLDYNMPGLDGLATLAELRRRHPEVAVVMITSTDNEGLAERVQAAGAAFLKKPFFPADVDAVLYRYFRMSPPAA